MPWNPIENPRLPEPNEMGKLGEATQAATAKADRKAVNPELAQLHDKLNELLAIQVERQRDTSSAFHTTLARITGSIEALRQVRGEVERLMNDALARPVLPTPAPPAETQAELQRRYDAQEPPPGER